MFDTSERPIVLVWEVSRACDLACDHCRAEATPDRHPDELTTAEGKRLLESAREFGEGQVVVLSGGDPLKRDDLEELVAHGDDLGLRMALTPSGTDSVTRDRLQRLADAGLRRVALSIDAADPAVHDGYRGEEGVLEGTLRAARAVEDAGIGLQVNTTVCERTVDELPGVRDLVAELDAVRWSVFFLVPVGRGAALEPVSPARADAVMDWLHRVEEEAPFAVKTTEAPQYRRVQLESGGVDPGDVDPERGPPATRPSVRAGDGFAFVSHVGDVTPSGFLPSQRGTSEKTTSSTCTRTPTCSNDSATAPRSAASAANASSAASAAGRAPGPTRSRATRSRQTRCARTSPTTTTGHSRRDSPTTRPRPRATTSVPTEPTHRRDPSALHRECEPWVPAVVPPS